MDDRPRTVGDGLTEKSMLYEDRDGDSLEWRESTEMQTLDGLLNFVERECFAVLQLVDLPQRYGGFAYHQSGRWMMAGDWAQARSLGTMSEPGWRLANIIWPIAEAAGHSHDSAVGFASRMLDDAVWIRRCDQKGDHERVAVFTFFLGVKRTELRMKVAHEKEWKTGKKQTDILADQRERANQARQREREQEWARWNAEASSVRAINPTLTSRSALAEAVIKRLGLAESVNTVRVRLNKVDEAG